MNVSVLYQTGLRPAELLTRLIGRASFFGVLLEPLRREAQPESSHRLGGSVAAAQPSL